MSDNHTSLWPFQKLLAKNNLKEADLPEKLRDRIAKLQAETDEDKQEALEQKVFDEVDDFIEEKKKTDKEAEQKKKRDALKKEKVGVSAAPTASDDDKKKPTTGNKVLGHIFGQ